jgi:hypothetical protein
MPPATSQITSYDSWGFRIIGRAIWILTACICHGFVVNPDTHPIMRDDGLHIDLNDGLPAFWLFKPAAHVPTSTDCVLLIPNTLRAYEEHRYV